MEPQVYKDWIAGIFDRSAAIYGKTNNNFFDHFAKELVRLAAIPKSSHVLDVATGRGAILKEAQLAVGPQGKVVGVDISPQMIQETSTELSHFNNVQLHCGDAEMLEFADHSFDFVFCGFAVFFFPDTQRALQEFFRVLKPGGKLLISTWGEDNYCDLIFKEVYEPFGFQVKTLLHNYDNKSFISERLSKSGFKEIEIISDELDHVYPTFEDWFSSLWATARRAKLEKLSAEQILQLKATLQDKMKPYLKKDGLHEALQVYYAQAIKTALA